MLAAGAARAHFGTSDSTAARVELPGIAEQAREDQRLAADVHAGEILARIGLGVAPAHRAPHRVGEGAPADTSVSTKPSVPDSRPSIRSTRSPLSVSLW